MLLFYTCSPGPHLRNSDMPCGVVAFTAQVDGIGPLGWICCYMDGTFEHVPSSWANTKYFSCDRADSASGSWMRQDLQYRSATWWMLHLSMCHPAELTLNISAAIELVQYSTHVDWYMLPLKSENMTTTSHTNGSVGGMRETLCYFAAFVYKSPKLGTANLFANGCKNKVIWLNSYFCNNPLSECLSF